MDNKENIFTKMTKKEIFDKIVAISADVCNVSVSDVMTQVRKADVVTARSIATFWCLSSKFTVQDMMSCVGLKNHNSIDSIRSKFEWRWEYEYCYHMLILEVGIQLLNYANSIGENFDLWTPIDHLQKITGKIYYKKPTK